MSTKDPISHNKIPVNGFNDKEWAIVAEDYMKQGLLHKFNQSTTLKQALISTGTRIIGEASPYDSNWGLGMRMSNVDIAHKEKWGKNKLGRLLMEVRQEILNN
jgi:hypothetical protein